MGFIDLVLGLTGLGDRSRSGEMKVAEGSFESPAEDTERMLDGVLRDFAVLGRLRGV